MNPDRTVTFASSTGQQVRMRAPKHLTLLQRCTVDFIREQAELYLRDYGPQMNHADPAQIGKALGAARALMQALVDTIPKSES